MRTFRLVLSLTVLPMVPCAAQSAHAQWWPLDSGSRIRIQAPQAGASAETGVVFKTTPDTLFVRATGQSAPYSVGLRDIKKLDVSAGKHSAKMRGTVFGFVSGAALGGGIAAALWKKPTNCGFCIDFGRGGDSAIGALFGGLLGSVVGLAIGAPSREKWVPVALPNR